MKTRKRNKKTVLAASLLISKHLKLETFPRSLRRYFIGDLETYDDSIMHFSDFRAFNSYDRASNYKNQVYSKENFGEKFGNG